MRLKILAVIFLFLAIGVLGVLLLFPPCKGGCGPYSSENAIRRSHAGDLAYGISECAKKNSAFLEGIPTDVPKEICRFGAEDCANKVKLDTLVGVCITQIPIDPQLQNKKTETNTTSYSIVIEGPYIVIRAMMLKDSVFGRERFIGEEPPIIPNKTNQASSRPITNSSERQITTNEEDIFSEGIKIDLQKLSGKDAIDLCAGQGSPRRSQLCFEDLAKMREPTMHPLVREWMHCHAGYIPTGRYPKPTDVTCSHSKEEIVREGGSIDFCNELVFSSTARNTCVELLATQTSSGLPCEQSYYRESCYVQLAISQKDPSLCYRTAIFSNKRSVCLAKVSPELKSTLDTVFIVITLLLLGALIFAFSKAKYLSGKNAYIAGIGLGLVMGLLSFLYYPTGFGNYLNVFAWPIIGIDLFLANASYSYSHESVMIAHNKSEFFRQCALCIFYYAAGFVLFHKRKPIIAGLVLLLPLAWTLLAFFLIASSFN